jgi:hypothetical protein
MDARKLNLIIQYSLLAAGDEDNFEDRKLGSIHIIKYVYLADLCYAKYNDGKTYTGVDWTFYKFGPWSQQVNAQIEPALVAINANRVRFSSDFEDKEDWVRWDINDEFLFTERRNQLPPKLASRLKQLIHQFGKDTPALLDYVYKTAPMLHAAPNEKLDFSIVVSEESAQVGLICTEIKERTTKQKKKFSEGMKLLREKYKKNQAQKLNLINPSQNSRYDEIYEQGLDWLESLSGEPFAPTTLEVEFSPEVWKSSARRNNEFS